MNKKFGYALSAFVTVALTLFAVSRCAGTGAGGGGGGTPTAGVSAHANGMKF